ncbi:hypothetical protein [Paraburkholderia sp. BL25I1N1]|uniref:hypothetical protein n=1 Tax=Paraburkholderia sp. BL25I1N1 TaxID=1938804 RepID=UPI000D4B5999|nr:hypothetical protein [Paraburkholderia sp. BL25I1N1]PRY05075.1 hypothetical protein B0G73_11027 [Paraburkholderia sp. BL25I1N1]
MNSPATLTVAGCFGTHASSRMKGIAGCARVVIDLFAQTPTHVRKTKSAKKKK